MARGDPTTDRVALTWRVPPARPRYEPTTWGRAIMQPVLLRAMLGLPTETETGKTTTEEEPP